MINLLELRAESPEKRARILEALESAGSLLEVERALNVDHFAWVKRRHEIEPPLLESSRLHTNAALKSLSLRIDRQLAELEAFVASPTWPYFPLTIELSFGEQLDRIARSIPSIAEVEQATGDRLPRN